MFWQAVAWSIGVQLPAPPPQTLGALPPPHESGDLHWPQSITFPHPSAIGPQAFAGQVLIGTHAPPPSPRMPPPPQTFG
jgi:hypothetical protein